MWLDIGYYIGDLVCHEIMVLGIEIVWLLYAQSPLVQWIIIFTIALVLVIDGHEAHLKGCLVHIIRKMEY